jgi:hypothetical protein
MTTAFDDALVENWELHDGTFTCQTQKIMWWQRR